MKAADTKVAGPKHKIPFALKCSVHATSLEQKGLYEIDNTTAEGALTVYGPWYSFNKVLMVAWTSQFL